MRGAVLRLRAAAQRRPAPNARGPQTPRVGSELTASRQYYFAAYACRSAREYRSFSPFDEETSMAHAFSGRAITHHHGRTPGQWYCQLAGLALLLAGAFGFISDSSFNTGDRIQGDLFLGFEVNAIHNLIHVASGLVLIAASPRRASARVAALGFGLVYGLVAIIGLIDGADVLGLIPINPADNLLHIPLAALGIITGLISRDDDRRRDATLLDRDSGSRFEPEAATTRPERTRR
jgi:hypothetical protein